MENEKLQLGAVQTNQRLLIYKLLTRYPQPYSEFRELIQNANDAQATEFEIDWHSDYLCCSNNGRSFSEEDWVRLVTISSGNPDETKVGAFGVGFYSVFGLTPTPKVTSGAKSMQFFWESDQLKFNFTNSNDNVNKTIFTFPFEGTNAFLWKSRDLRILLARMIVFTKYMHTITLSFETELSLKINKRVSQVSTEMKMFEVVSPSKVFCLKAPVEYRTVDLQITGQMTPGPLTSETLSFVLVEATADVLISDTDPLGEKILRIIQKQRLQQCVKIQLLFPSSSTESDWYHAISPSDSRGLVAIGFFSQQTVGTSFHINLPVFSTFDRENLDFENASLKKWNEDLLFLAGTVARVYYDSQIKNISSTEGYQTLLKQFAFFPSTPKAHVGESVFQGFLQKGNTQFGALQVPFINYRTQEGGTKPVYEVFLPIKNKGSRFVSMATFPEEMIEKERSIANFTNLLRNNYLIRNSTVQEFISRLGQASTMNSLQLPEFFKWILQIEEFYLKKEEIFKKIVLIKNDNKTLFLSDVLYFPTLEFFELPLPPDCLPCEFVQEKLSKRDLEKLEFIPITRDLWWNYVSLSAVLEQPSMYLVNTLLYVAKQPDKSAFFVPFLQKTQCIFTDFNDMRLPNECYFPSVTLLPVPHTAFHKIDPNVSIPNGFLEQLGVKNKIEVKIVLKHLDQLNWNTVQIFEFLTESATHMNEEDHKVLQTTKFIPFRQQIIDGQLVVGKELGEALYFPGNNGEVFALGLKVVDLPPEILGLNSHFFETIIKIHKHPSLETILLLASNKESIALHYFLSNFHDYKASYSASTTHKFIPTLNGEFCSPSECYQEQNPFGLPVITTAILPHAEALGIKKHPELSLLINKFISNVPPPGLISEFYDYLSSRLTEFQLEQLELLKSQNIVYNETNNLVTPVGVFLKSPENDKYQNLLTLVDYGNQGNKFLKKIGVGKVPTKDDLVLGLAQNASSFLARIGPDAYLDHLCDIAKSFSALSDKCKSILKELPVLVAYTYSDDNRQVKMCTAKECFLIDNVYYVTEFNPWVAKFDEFEHFGSAVNSALKVTAPFQENEKSREFLLLVKTRKPLLMTKEDRKRIESLKPDIEDHFNNMEIKVVSSIIKEIIFQEKSISIPVQSGFLSERPNTIFITNSATIADLAESLVQFMHSSHEKPFQEETRIQYLLTTDLNSLRWKGYTVDKIIGMPVKPPVELPKQVQEAIKEEKHIEVQETVHIDPKIEEKSIEPVLQEPEDESERGTESYPTSTHHTTELIAKDDTEDEAEFLTDSTSESESSEDDMEIAQNNFYKLASLVVEQVAEADTSEKSNEFTVSRCETIPTASLVENGFFKEISFFVKEGSKAKHLPKQSVLELFSDILVAMATLFEVPTTTIHMFWEDKSTMIAFNSDNQLYFNVRYFDCWHYHKGTVKMKEATVFWFFSFCHELAHHVEKLHNEAHEYVMQAIATKYMPKLVEIMKEL